MTAKEFSSWLLTKSEEYQEKHELAGIFEVDPFFEVFTMFCNVKLTDPPIESDQDSLHCEDCPCWDKPKPGEAYFCTLALSDVPKYPYEYCYLGREIMARKRRETR